MLTISRPDVRSDVFQDFPVAERFVKLPIQNYLDLIGMEANGPQIALVNALNNPKYRFVCAALSRRLGKTYISNIVAHLVTLIPGTSVLIMSPNYNLSQISFELQRSFIGKFKIELDKDNAKDRIIQLSNGSTIRMGSVNQVDACVGRSYDLILFDEAALTSEGEDAFNIQLRPTLDKMGAKAVFISTPRGKNNWFSKFFQRGFTPEFHDWCSIHADYRENIRMTEADIASAKLSMSKAEFEQEYMASFTSFAGQIYEFNTEKCVLKEVPEGVKFDLVICGIDVGFKDPTAYCVIGVDESEDLPKYYVVDEYLNSEATTDMHAQALLELTEKWGIESIFIDSAAQQTRMDWAYNYGIATNNAKKSVLDGIAYCQSVIDNDRLYVLEHCTHTLSMLDQYRWKQDAMSGIEKPVHDEYSHMGDAFRYGLYSFSTVTSSV